MTSDRTTSEDSERPPAIEPSPDNLVCAKCGSALIECIDWVRVNDNCFIGGIDGLQADDYWCPDCEIHDDPVTAEEYCAAHGHREARCTVCGAS